MNRLVRDVMRTGVVTVPTNSTLHEALKLFESRMISGAPVVDHGRVVGVLSRSDVLSHVSRGGTLDEEAGKVMTPYVFHIGPDESIAKLLDMMLPLRIHRVVVTSDAGEPLGILTSLDLMEEMRRMLAR